MAVDATDVLCIMMYSVLWKSPPRSRKHLVSIRRLVTSCTESVFYTLSSPSSYDVRLKLFYTLAPTFLFLFIFSLRH